MKQLDELEINNKKIIIFDLDGTLIDSIGIWNDSDHLLVKKYGKIEIDENTLQKQRDDFFHANVIGDIYREYNRFLINKYKLTIDEETFNNQRWKFVKNFFENELDYKEGSIELINDLKYKGYTLVLATMTTRSQIDIYTYKNKKMSEKLNIYDTFDLIITKDEVKNKKPHPEIFNKIVDYFKVSKKECLIIEDSLTGVLAANKAGIEVINVYEKHSKFNRDKINSITDYYVDDLDSIRQLFNNKKIKKLRK